MFQGVIGLILFPLIAWALSERRGEVDLKALVVGLAVQLGLAALLLGVPPIKDAFLGLNIIVTGLQDATRAGTSFVFGYIGGGTLPFAETAPGASFNLAFQALPLILVVSALSALLFYWRILPLIVKGASFLLAKIFGIGGALGVSVAANIFIGMVESPVLIRPYLQRMSRGELFVMMTAGLATVAGTVIVLYATFVEPLVPGALGHILTASVMSAAAAITIAQVMVPLDQPTPGEIDLPDDRSAFAAITRGTVDGVQLLINVIALLLVTVALVALANALLGLLPDIAGAPISLERLLGWAMAPLMFATGVPWSEAVDAGQLMGVKIVLNEFIAYLQFAEVGAEGMSDKTKLILTYALCGFANFASLGIMIGGLSTMCPERRDEIVDLGAKSMISSTLALLLTGTVAGFFA